MNHFQRTSLLICLLLGIPCVAQADLKQDSTVLITGAAAAPKSAGTSVSEAKRSDAFTFDKKSVRSADKTLRCWQDGILIVAEHDWSLAVAQTPILTNKNSKKAYAFNYSDTFCLYIGG